MDHGNSVKVMLKSKHDHTYSLSGALTSFFISLFLYYNLDRTLLWFSLTVSEMYKKLILLGVHITLCVFHYNANGSLIFMCRDSDAIFCIFHDLKAQV